MRQHRDASATKRTSVMAHVFSELGRRERQIMDIIVRRGRATAGDVMNDLPDPPSNSSVRSMLSLLEEKGFLRHEWDGPRYVYSPVGDPAQIRRSAMKHLLRTFFDDSMESAVAAMLGA